MITPSAVDLCFNPWSKQKTIKLSSFKEQDQRPKTNCEAMWVDESDSKSANQDVAKSKVVLTQIK